MKVISGGQTGVDRAALDAAIALGLPHGGWCPRGRKAEDGIIPKRYHLKQHKSPKYPPRTAANIDRAQATLILWRKRRFGRGTELTIRMCQSMKKPYIIVDLADKNDMHVGFLQRWLKENHVRVLNVAGPRESSDPGVQREATWFLLDLFAA